MVRRDDLLGSVRARGEQIARALEPLSVHPAVREVRGRGLMWGVELNPPGDGRTASQLADEVQARALRAGLILELGGRDDCVVRMLPPLNVTAEVVDIALTIMIRAIDDTFRQQVLAA